MLYNIYIFVNIKTHSVSQPGSTADYKLSYNIIALDFDTPIKEKLLKSRKMNLKEENSKMFSKYSLTIKCYKRAPLVKNVCPLRLDKYSGVPAIGFLK